MTGTDLLCAVAAADEKLASESERFSVIAGEIRADKKKKQRRLAAASVAAVLCAAGFGVVKYAPRLFKVFSLPDTSTFQASDRTDSMGTTTSPDATRPEDTTEEAVGGVPFPEQASTTGNGNDSPSPGTAPLPTEPSTQPPQTETPSSSGETDASPSEPSVEASSEVETTVVSQEEPQTVYRDVLVDHGTAETYFRHPLVPCGRNDFNGYCVLLGSPNGNSDGSETTCLSVTYLFENGSVSLYDQDRTGEIIPSGKASSYDGRTFYVHMPEFNGDPLRVAFFPTGGSGVAYQASFGRGTDAGEIMDLLITLEM